MQQQHSVNSYRHDNSPDRDQRHPYENGISEVESGDEGSPVVVRRSAGFRGSSLSPSTPVPNGQVQLMTQSSPGGADGYDAFENTNNKKKRKIPTSGTLNSHHSSLTSEHATAGISGSTTGSPATLADSGAGTYYGSGSPATSSVGNGISGPGRGRYGRHAPRAIGIRNSLPVHSQNAWLGGRPGSSRRDLLSSSHQGTGEKSDQGIISTAIANAAALSPSTKGGNNVSLLEQQASKTSPTKTQFTFTCESDSSKNIALHPPNPYPLSHQRIPNPSMPATTPNSRDFATQGTQTSPHMGAVTSQQQSVPGTGTPSHNPGQRPRRSRDSIYALAARRRKIQQHYANAHNPPSPEDLWICEFCEYETIFGEPPRALIRQYEIKDRKERRRLAEKRRLLEKAKMKGRKNKKATKNSAKHPNAQQPTHHHHSDHHHMDSPHPDDYLNGYDDDVPPMTAPAPPQQNVNRPPTVTSNAGRPPPLAEPILPEGTGGSRGMNRPA
ncbi:hypothetical protein BGW36DRAFT_104393 [Talaromyces proteolyticus]|uniref:Uncharacterized protein n=1 Tax=Talaromyces proteolyticus TaxID=1131652 RepID=A0AAD4KWI6_9EURO|nr:uncharacterized protein BGW36DRAFT_104393 [Talaromyces proteolyticus]KAH8701739.1 hypothetical protein BGW36DRAFT_104393 [Talaromyces proteolyticus]